MNPRREEIIAAIRAGEAAGALPIVPAPYPQRPTEPRCEDHCKRHRVESTLACRTHGPSYRLIAHEHAMGEGGHHWYTTEPLNGAPTLEPRQKPRCRECGGQLERS